MHPNRDDLRRYLLGTLPESSALAVEQHVLVCTACDSTLARLETTADTLVSRLQRGFPDDPLAHEPGCHDLVARIGQFCPPQTINQPAAAAYRKAKSDGGS